MNTAPQGKLTPLFNANKIETAQVAHDVPARKIKTFAEVRAERAAEKQRVASQKLFDDLLEAHEKKEAPKPKEEASEPKKSAGVAMGMSWRAGGHQFPKSGIIKSISNLHAWFPDTNPTNTQWKTLTKDKLLEQWGELQEGIKKKHGIEAHGAEAIPPVPYDFGAAYRKAREEKPKKQLTAAMLAGLAAGREKAKANREAKAARYAEAAAKYKS